MDQENRTHNEHTKSYHTSIICFSQHYREQPPAWWKCRTLSDEFLKPELSWIECAGSRCIQNVEEQYTTGWSGDQKHHVHMSCVSCHAMSCHVMSWYVTYIMYLFIVGSIYRSIDLSICLCMDVCMDGMDGMNGYESCCSAQNVFCRVPRFGKNMEELSCECFLFWSGTSEISWLQVF